LVMTNLSHQDNDIPMNKFTIKYNNKEN
jgi:hypothetical protein